MKKFLIGAAAAALIFGSLAASAFAAVLANGSFENGTDPGAYTTLNAGDPAINNWSIDSGSIDYIGSYWQATDGSRSVDLNGLTTGSISQALTTVTGATYNVSFMLSGNPDSRSDVSDPLYSPSNKQMTVGATGASLQTYSFDTSAKGNSLSDMKWETESYSFVATGTNTTLTFASTIPGAFGPAVDNVSVEEIPPTPTLTPTLTPTSTPTPTPALVGPPTSVKQCVRGEWKTFNNPVFKNQWLCALYVIMHRPRPGKVDVDIKMSGPKQKMDADLREGSSSNQGRVEYQNFEYPGGLHYTTKALCVYVDKTTKESRFMFQIPSGHPGLSGLYIVSDVKDGGAPGKTHDHYGHAATADLATAQDWCATGTGFSPAMYQITDGNIVVH
jgi:choice-of-anchor C domain-containing protein